MSKPAFGTTTVKRTFGNRMFGPGRFFIHPPFSSDLSKARDTFIRFKTLVRLSHLKGTAIRSAVADNLAVRLAADLKPALIPKFNPEVFIEALIRAREINEAVVQSTELIDILGKATPKDLEKLATSQAEIIRLFVAGSKNAPRETLLNMTFDKSAAGLAAYKNLEQGLTRGELTRISLSGNPPVMKQVILHHRTPADLAAKIILELIEKSGLAEKGAMEISKFALSLLDSDKQKDIMEILANKKPEWFSAD